MPATSLIFAGVENGLLAWAKVGGQWRTAPRQLTGHRVVDVAVCPRNPARMLAATDAGLFKTDDGGRDWQQVFDRPVTRAVFDARNAGAVWAAVSPAGLFFCPDDGASWRDMSAPLSQLADEADWYAPEPPFEPVISALLQHSAAPAALWLGVSVGGAYRSVDGGASWQAMDDGLDDDVLALAFGADPPGVCWAGTGAGLFVRQSGLWRSASDEMAGQVVSVVAVASDGRVWAAASGTPAGTWVENAVSTVWCSADGGQSWLPTPLPTPEFVTALVALGRAAVCSTQSGAIYRHSGQAGWQKIGQADSTVHVLQAVRVG